jgi:hypothetical protein
LYSGGLSILKSLPAAVNPTLIKRTNKNGGKTQLAGKPRWRGTKMAGKPKWRENRNGGKTEMVGKPRHREKGVGGWNTRLVERIRQKNKEQMARKPNRNEKGYRGGVLAILKSGWVM